MPEVRDKNYTGTTDKILLIKEDTVSYTCIWDGDFLCTEKTWQKE